MLTIFSDLYLKLFYLQIQEEEENSYRPESEGNNLKSRNTIDNDPITSRTTFPVMERRSNVKRKMIEEIECETINMNEWTSEYIQY